MTTRDHLLFLILGFAMLALSRVSPGWLDPKDPDGLNGPALWLAGMGTIQAAVGVYGLCRSRLFLDFQPGRALREGIAELAEAPEDGMAEQSPAGETHS